MSSRLHSATSSLHLKSFTGSRPVALVWLLLLCTAVASLWWNWYGLRSVSTLLRPHRGSGLSAAGHAELQADSGDLAEAAWLCDGDPPKLKTRSLREYRHLQCAIG